MSLLRRVLGMEKRAGEVTTSDPYLGEIIGMSGWRGSVDIDRAGGLPTALACVSTGASLAASLPLHLYKTNENGGRSLARDHPLYEVVHDRFNDRVNAFEGREYLIASLMMHGNAYARIIWNGRAQVTGLEPLHPSQVTPETVRSGRIRYRVRRADGTEEILLPEEVLHIRNRIGRDGIRGVSPIQEARETFATGLAQQSAAQRMAAKGFRPEGALVFQQSIGSNVRAQALDALREKIQSDSDTASVHILDGGIEWKPFSFSSRDSEFLASRAMTDEAICRIFNMPPTAVGILTHGTYSNVEQESRALVVRFLAPMLRRVEMAMNAALLPELARQSLFIEHDLAGLLRGDMQARFASYQIGRNWGWLSTNDVRRWENLPEIEGGDDYLTPLNMIAKGEGDGGAGV